jgi:hypothetical protein
MYYVGTFLSTSLTYTTLSTFLFPEIKYLAEMEMKVLTCVDTDG